MGASLALAGVGGCRWEKAEILPFAERPPERTPGKPQRYATAMDLGGSAIGLLVTCVDGRPIKIEGNPEHPASLGATDAIAQAAILQLYDPDRSQNVVERAGGQEIIQTWQAFEEFVRSHFGKLRETGGAGFRVLAEAGSSPTLAATRNRLLEAFPEARWHEYEPVARRGPSKPVRFELDKADVIVCLDDDLLGSGPSALRCARQFADRREPSSGPMSRLYAVESRLTVTGAAADHRLPLRSDHVAGFVTILEQEIAALLKRPDASPRPPRELSGLQFPFTMAEDLVASRGSSVVTVGPGQLAEVHAAVARINAALGNVGTTVLYMEPAAAETNWRGREESSIETSAAAMNAGEVQTLVLLGGNPVYNAPADLGFAEALKEVETSIHLALYRDETSRRCFWHLPQPIFSKRGATPGPTTARTVSSSR